MDAAEVGKLLALMAAYDQRKVGEADIAAWLMVVGDLDFEDAKLAVVKYHAITADRRIMPADVVKFAKSRQDDRERRERRDRMTMAEQIEDAIPDADPDDVTGYLAALREGRMRSYDDGTARPRPIRALMSRVFKSPPGGDE